MLEGRSGRGPERPVLWDDVWEPEVEATEWPLSWDGELLPLNGRRAVAGEEGWR
jgi:hypothetical protein